MESLASPRRVIWGSKLGFLLVRVASEKVEMGQSRWSTRTKRLKDNVDLEMGNVAMELELKGCDVNVMV